MIKSYLTEKSSETEKLGKKLAQKILEEKAKKTFILGLQSDLGGGKTTFLQGFAKGLGVKEKVLSPTFVVIRKFRVKSSKVKNFYHIDCYRLGGLKEILDLGFERIISDPENIVALEWADKIRKIMPKGAIWIKFKFIDKEKREIIIKTSQRFSLSL